MKFKPEAYPFVRHARRATRATAWPRIFAAADPLARPRSSLRQTLRLGVRKPTR